MNRLVPKNLSAKNPERKAFYFLVAGNVFFYPKDTPEEPGSLPLNCIVSNESGQFPVSMLSNAQRGLSQALIDKVGPEANLVVADVQITNVCKLGHMLPSEFHDIGGQLAIDDVAPAKVQ